MEIAKELFRSVCKFVVNLSAIIVLLYLVVTIPVFLIGLSNKLTGIFSVSLTLTALILIFVIISSLTHIVKISIDKLYCGVGDDNKRIE